MMKRILYMAFALTMVMSVASDAIAQHLEYVGGGSIGDGKFQIEYQLSSAKSGGNFTAPVVEGAKKLYQSSPQCIGSSSSTVIVNGKMVENSSGGTYRYTVTYKAEKEGRLKVGTASVSLGGQKYTASGFSINVSNNRPQQQSISSMLNQRRGGGIDPTDPFTQTDDKQVTNKDLFVRVEMSKPRVYEQQAVVCTIKLYTKFGIKEFISKRQPEFNGFLIEDITPKYSGNPVVEKYNGQNYYTVVLRKSILYPQKSGKLTINSGEFEVTPIQTQVYVGLNSAIAVPVEGNRLFIKSNASSVNIEPLPSPAPAGFTGAVGEFSVKNSITPTDLKTYAPATYTVTVTGSGNIKYIKAPTIGFPKEFDTYDAQNKINVSGEGDDVHGNVTFNYQFIPQFEGNYPIEAWNFVYFNPNTGKYETISFPQQTLTIGKGNGQPSSHYKNADRMKDIRDLRHGDLDLQKSHTLFVDCLGYWLGFILPLLAFCGILIYYRKLVRERADVQLMRTKHASKLAQRRLKQAKKHMEANNKEQFYTEVLKAMWGYLSDKLGIPVSELSKDNIALELSNYGMDQAVTDRTLALLDKCEFAQYAPELNDNNMKAIFNEAADVMDQLESVKRKKQA